MGKDRVKKGPWAGQGSQEVWPSSYNLPPKILGFFQKFPYKLLNSLLPLILEIWKDNFEKREILI
jgi:hypothetical protein